MDFSLKSQKRLCERENAGYQQFLLFQQGFQKRSSSELSKREFVWLKGYILMCSTYKYLKARSEG